MTGAVLLAVVSVLLTVALVAWLARRNPDHHRSYRPLDGEFRVWEIEATREADRG